MNKTSTILGIIIVLLIVVGGVYYANQSSQSNTASSTPTTENSADNGTTDASGNTTDITQTTTMITQTPGVPAVTTGPKAFPTDTTVTITGGVVPNGTFTNYWFEYGTSASVPNKTSVQSVGSGYAQTPTPAYIVGLKANTTYYYQLVAENQLGKAAGTQYSFKTTQGNPPPSASAPVVKTLAANGVSKSTANLNGNVNPNKDATQYWFEYGKTKDLGNTTTFTAIGSGSVSKLASFTLSDLATSTTYYFRINAQNQFGTVNGTILNFKTSK